MMGGFPLNSQLHYAGYHTPIFGVHFVLRVLLWWWAPSGELKPRILPKNTMYLHVQIKGCRSPKATHTKTPEVTMHTTSRQGWIMSRGHNNTVQGTRFPFLAGGQPIFGPQPHTLPACSHSLSTLWPHVSSKVCTPDGDTHHVFSSTGATRTNQRNCAGRAAELKTSRCRNIGGITWPEIPRASCGTVEWSVESNE